MRELAAIAVVVGVASVAEAAPSLQMATSEPPAPVPAVRVDQSVDESAPMEVAIGRFAMEPYMTRAPDGTQHYGGRVGVDMLVARSEQRTRFAGGLRFLLGGDGGGHFGPEGALLVGVAHVLGRDTVAALVVPMGFAMTMDTGFGVHGVIGLEGTLVAHGLDLGAGLSNRGSRAHAGIVRPGREAGVGVGFEWQRDVGIDLLGVYVATTPGRR